MIPSERILVSVAQNNCNSVLVPPNPGWDACLLPGQSTEQYVSDSYLYTYRYLSTVGEERNKIAQGNSTYYCYLTLSWLNIVVHFTG